MTVPGPSPAPLPPEPPDRGGSSSGQVAAAIGGGLLALLAAALMVSGAIVALAYAFARDDDGYFTSPTERVVTVTPAITGEGLDLGDVHGNAGDWLADAIDVTARVTVSAPGGEPLFVGIGPESDVDAYLARVAHDEVTDVHGGDVSYRRSSGADRAAPPAAQRFWAASAQGPGRQTVTWRPDSGRWSAVVMRFDGRAGVEADVSVGARSRAVLWAGFLLIGAGIVVAVPAGLLIWLGVRTRPRRDPPR
jgi:hypothetical protein